MKNKNEDYYKKRALVYKTIIVIVSIAVIVCWGIFYFGPVEREYGPPTFVQVFFSVEIEGLFSLLLWFFMFLSFLLIPALIVVPILFFKNNTSEKYYLRLIIIVFMLMLSLSILAISIFNEVYHSFSGSLENIDYIYWFFSPILVLLLTLIPLIILLYKIEKQRKNFNKEKK